jgi:acetyltransferase-like isoleucine patch superfamily enzyme
MIKNILIWVIKKYKLNKVISELDIELKLKRIENYTTNKGSTFYPEANVYNFQNDKLKIVIGYNTHIRGTLHVFKYGGFIKIGNNTYIGDNTRIWSGEYISIGNNVLISHNVNIIDTSAHEKDAFERSERFLDLIKNGPWVSKGNVLTEPIYIGDYVWISFNVSILRGVTIGEGAIIGANSVVTKDIPPFSLSVGNPAKVIKYLNHKN